MLEKFRKCVLTGIILASLAAMVWIWIPTESDTLKMRTLIVYEPPLGHWIYEEAELQAVYDRIKEIKHKAETSDPVSYPAAEHFANMEWLTDVQKSLLPLEIVTRWHPRGPVGKSWQPIKGASYNVTPKAAYMIRDIPVQLAFDTNIIVGKFGNRPREELERVAQMAEKSNLAKKSLHPVYDYEYHHGSALKWFAWTYFTKSTVVALGFYAARVQLMGITPWALVTQLAQLPRTLFWVCFWPFGIFVFPTPKALNVVRVMARQVAWAMSMFLSLAVPSMAKAQNRKSGDGKTNAPYALIVRADTTTPTEPKNSLAITLEVVDKYHGGVVGEIFAPQPAPRFLARYTRGSLYADLWSSAGSGYNMEADLAVGVAKRGWDVSLTHFLIRGGDVAQLFVARTGTVKFGKRRVPLGANFFYFARTRSTSPPGGVVLKVSSGVNHPIGLGSNFQLRHKVGLGIDNNPFGLGQGTSAVGFYSVEAGWKKWYLAWHASEPFAGVSNTTRGFRQSFAAGFRHNFAW